MAIQEFEPSGQPDPQFAVWQVYEDGELFHHLIIDGSDKGVIDWETNIDGSLGAIDGLDAEAEITARGIRDVAWLAIAACMQNMYPQVREIDHLDGTISFVQE